MSKAALRGLEKETTNINEENIHQGRKRGCQSNNINQDLYYRNSQGCRNSIGKSNLSNFDEFRRFFKWLENGSNFLQYRNDSATLTLRIS